MIEKMKEVYEAGDYVVIINQNRDNYGKIGVLVRHHLLVSGAMMTVCKDQWEVDVDSESNIDGKLEIYNLGEFELLRYTTNVDKDVDKDVEESMNWETGKYENQTGAFNKHPEPGLEKPSDDKLSEILKSWHDYGQMRHLEKTEVTKDNEDDQFWATMPTSALIMVLVGGMMLILGSIDNLGSAGNLVVLIIGVVIVAFGLMASYLKKKR